MSSKNYRVSCRRLHQVRVDEKSSSGPLQKNILYPQYRGQAFSSWLLLIYQHFPWNWEISRLAVFSLWFICANTQLHSTILAQHYYFWAYQHVLLWIKYKLWLLSFFLPLAVGCFGALLGICAEEAEGCRQKEPEVQRNLSVIDEFQTLSHHRIGQNLVEKWFKTG